MSQSFRWRKPLMFVAVVGSLACGYVLFGHFSDNEPPRLPASVPTNYDSLSACEKQDVLWRKAEASIYREMPETQKFGVMQLLALGQQEISPKGKLHSDFAPQGWKKYLHARGALAKVKIVAKKSAYTGIFQGADCAMLRLSLTYKTAANRPVAPGLALKVLRDGTHSANISALVSLDGQDKDYNFFKNPMSNIVPIGEDMGQKLVHRIFNKVTKYPEELLAYDMASVDAKGLMSATVKAPRQIFFVPGEGLSFSSDEHEVRNDFLSIPEGTVIYQVFLAPDKYAKFDYSKYKPANVAAFVHESQHVADIVTTSKFVSSKFGDDEIFFRHQLRP